MLWAASPIKGQFNTLHGYATACGYGKTREVACTFNVAPDRTVEMAYEAASDLATLLNIAAE